MAIIGVIFSLISLLIGAAALVFSVATYLAGNRPFIVVTSVNASDFGDNDEPVSKIMGIV
jgi:hypothetical protein